MKNSEFNKIADVEKEKMKKEVNAKLEVITMDELYETAYQGKNPIIEGLLYPGTYLFAGAPKLGKSFLMAQLAYHVSIGKSIWGYMVRKGKVLYLALEDDYRRLQERLYRMFGTESTEDLFFSASAGQIGKGLDEQLRFFMKEHKDTKLIIIDTLQKIREFGRESYSYACDYEIIARLKKFTDEYEIGMLLVHHTRKQAAEDKFDMISGTTGLFGTADGAFLLQKEKCTSNSATLEVSGRDQQDQKLYLVRNEKTLIWDFEKAETELWKEAPDPLLEEIAKRVNRNFPLWHGTATELSLWLGVDIQPNILTKKLNITSGKLFEDYGISYTRKRLHEGRKIILSYNECDDG